MKTDSGGRDYKSKYTEKSITGRKADREYKAKPYIAAGISGRGGPVTGLVRAVLHLLLSSVHAARHSGAYGYKK